MTTTGDDISELGQRLAQRRRAAGLSMSALARRVDMSVSHLSAIESGTNLPSLSLLARIARALDVSMAEVLRSTDRGRLAGGTVSASGFGTQSISDDRLDLDVRNLRARPGAGGRAPVAIEPAVALHVREGAVTVDVDSEAHELAAGDTLHATRPGSVRWRAGAAGCVVVWIGLRSN